MLNGVLAVAQATRSELLRRPGLLLTTVGAGSLLLVLHDLSASAFDTTGALARELTHSTNGLVLAVIGLVAGVRCGSRAEELGPTSEWRATSMGTGGYVTGRFVGVCQANASLLAVLVVFTALAYWRAGDAWTSEAALALVGAWFAAAAFAALGILLGAVFPLPLALVLGFVVFATTRVVEFDGGQLPAWAQSALVLRPDPSRLDLSREAGFAVALPASSVVLALLGSTLQCGGLLAAASAILRRREN